MRTIEATQYLDLADRLETANDNTARETARTELATVFPEQGEQNVIRRARRLREVKPAARHSLMICLDGPPQALAFVMPGDARTYLNDNSLDLSREHANYAIHHEETHHTSNVFTLDIAVIKQPARNAIEKNIGVVEWDERALIEGFTDLHTSNEHSGREISGYQTREVPIARRLEDLAKRILRLSLLDLFITGKKDELVSALARLGTRLSLEGALQ